MSLLLKHFFQSLRGIGAMDSFGHGAKRRVRIKRNQHTHSHYARTGWRFTPSHGQPERIVWVEVCVRPDWAPNPGLLEVTYCYTYTVPGYSSPNTGRWVHARDDWQHRTAVFTNPVKAAEYVAGYLGYAEEPSCECHQSDCALAA